MKTILALSKITLLLPLLALLVGRADAQALESIKSQEELDKLIASLDVALFDSYNRCDLDKFSTFLADDVEFYHDQGGVYAAFKSLSIKVARTGTAGICGFAKSR